ncbi:MAG: AAA family ATPase, partial [Sphaerochaetaceae bacterium]|nr:AAA family ATPase [Sphaerochaetaceae bacterium]
DENQSPTVRYITKAIAEESIQKKAVLYDKEGDYHFDTISAFIKSIRGSDPDAALYWMAKMISAGEDPSFIFRRMLISAAEDIGLADPQAMQIVLADAQAFDRIGLPEGRFHLSHAALYLATAPKSNSTMAFFDALRTVENEKDADVPNHLRDASRDAKGFGHGQGYLYPHAFKDHWVAQQYLPSSLQGKFFYNPGTVGYEGKMNEMILRRREAQNEVSLDDLSIEKLTTSPDDKNNSRWIQRMLSQQGEAFEQIREAVFSPLKVARYENILVMNPGHGFLVWESLRAAPEGSVTVITRNRDEIEYLKNYSATLDELRRPVLLEKTAQELKENGDDMRWEKILSFNPLSTLNSRTEILKPVHSLLAEGGTFSFAQAVPSRSTRLSSYCEDKTIQDIMIESEKSIYSDKGNELTNWNEKDLIETVSRLPWKVEYEQLSQRQTRTFTEKMIRRFIHSSYLSHIKDEESTESVIDHLCKMLCNKEVDFNRVFIIVRCSKIDETY